MSFQLKPDEALEALQKVEPEIAAHFENILCSATSAMAEILAKHGDFECGAATMEGVAFAGICVPVMPSYKGQPLPSFLEGYDNETSWGEDFEGDEEAPPSKARYFEWFAARDGETHHDSCIAENLEKATKIALANCALALRISHLVDLDEIRAELDGFSIFETTRK